MFDKEFTGGIAFRFLKVISIILLVSAFLLSALIAMNEERILEHSLTTKGTGLASFIGKLSQDPLVHGDGVALDAIVNEANQDEDLLYAVVLDAKGKILTSKYASVNYRSRRLSAILQELPKNLDLPEIIAAIGRRESIKEITTPVFIDIKNIGTVTVGLSRNKIRSEVTRTIVFVLGLNLLAAILMGVFLYAFSRSIILKPIRTLADAADRLAKGNLSTSVKMETTGEVKMLVDSFNRMAEDLEKTTVSKNHMNNVIGSMADTLVILSHDGTIRSGNAAVCRLLGYEEKELAGRPLETILDAGSQGGRSVIGEVMEKGGIGNREVRYASKFGRIIPMLFSASPMFDEFGGFEGVVCMARDITDRKKQEEELARLGMAVEQAGESIVITDAQGTIQYVNPAFERTSGYTRAEVMGRNPRILQSGSHDPAHYRAMWDTLLAGGTWSGNLVNRKRDGTLFEEVAVISPVRDAAGRVVNYVAVKRDVTHEMEMEEQLRQSQKMEAVGKLAGGIAHDFNNLLTAITGYSELILAGLPGESPVSREVEEIRKAADRASSLTRQLLAFSRRQVFQVRVVNLNEVVLNLDKLLRRLIGEDIDLRTSFREDLWSVRIDPGQIEQVIVNLVVNARDAMPEGGKITIETANVELDEKYTGRHAVVKPGSYVMLAITDSGCGMDEATKARIFEPFFTTKGPGKGTGLGLSTVYGIIKQSAGNIWAYSEPGKGTTFKVYLPRVLEEVEHSAVVRETAESGWGGPETVLLAEDEDLVRDLVMEILKPGGYSVLLARDGEEAVRISERYEGTIHLLITDVVMPRMNGRDLVCRILPSRPQMKVIYMSGYTEDAIVHHGILDEKTHFIQKPFRPKDLARKIREVLDASAPA